MIPLSAGEITFSQHVSELVFLLSNLIWILGSRLILSNNQSNATLWVRDTCLIVDFNRLWTLDLCFVVFKTLQLSFDDNVIRPFINFSVTASLRFGVGVDALDIFACTVSLHLIIDLSFSTVISYCLMDVFSKNAILFSPHPTEKKARIPSIRKPASREKSDSVELWDTDVCFFQIQLTGTNVRLPRKNMRFSLMLISSLQSLHQNLSLGKTQSTVLSCVAHMTTWYVISRVMNVRHQTIWAMVTCSCRFRDRSTKFVYRPQKLKHFKTICEHTFEKSPTYWRSSIGRWPNRKCWRIYWFRFSAWFRKPKTLFTACWKSVLFFLHWPWLLSSSINVKSKIVFILLTLSPRSCLWEINEYERNPILVMFSGPSDDDLEIFAQFILLKSFHNKRTSSLSFVCKWHCFSWDLQCFAPRERFLCTT